MLGNFHEKAFVKDIKNVNWSAATLNDTENRFVNIIVIVSNLMNKANRRSKKSNQNEVVN